MTLKDDGDSGRSIGFVGNYYGGLHTREDGGRFYWCIENYDGFSWDEIPKGLYDALNSYEDERLAK